MLLCSFCGQYPTIKSNKAIHEDLSRFWKPFDAIAVLTCPNHACPNHYIGTEQGKTHYHSFGRTKQALYAILARHAAEHSLPLRLRRSGHRKPHKNTVIFRLLVNEVPLRRICEAEGISMPTLYRKIDFIHRQCLSFAAQRERNLPCRWPASTSELTGKTI